MNGYAAHVAREFSALTGYEREERLVIARRVTRRTTLGSFKELSPLELDEMLDMAREIYLARHGEMPARDVRRYTAARLEGLAA